MLPWPLLAALLAASPPAEPPEAPMSVTADLLRYQPQLGLLEAEGHVTAESEGITLRADRLTYDRTTGQAVATGNASLASGRSAALAERISVNVFTLESDATRAFFLQKQHVSPEALAAATPEQLRTLGSN